MKKKIDNILHQLDSYPLPDKTKILAAFPEVSAEAEEPVKAPIPVRRRLSPAKLAALAMAALLVVGGGITVAAMEAKEYNEAMDFFEEYNLSAEGFSRSEIKKIYRDIVSESFTYEKTEEALASGLVGYEIQSKPLDSDGLKRLWQLGYVWSIGDQQQSGEVGVQYRYDLGVTSEKLQFSEVIKMKNDQRVWKKRLDDFYVQEVRPVGDYVFVAGEAYQNGEGTRTVRVYLLDSDSDVVWCKDYKSNLSVPVVNYMLYQKGNCILFSASNDRMWILTIDMNGNYVSDRYARYDTTGAKITKVVSLGDGYLMLKGNQLMQEKNGTVQKMASLQNGNEQYQITDSVEFNGLVYLSGRVVPNISIADGKDILDYYEERFGQTLCSTEELTQFFKEQYTAVLLICDPNSGQLQQFYTIPGATGSNLTVKDNKLTWNVNRYAKVQHICETYKDVRIGYLVGAGFGLVQAAIWQYVFSPYGQVVGEKDTGRSVEYEDFPS